MVRGLELSSTPPCKAGCERREEEKTPPARAEKSLDWDAVVF